MERIIKFRTNKDGVVGTSNKNGEVKIEFSTKKFFVSGTYQKKYTKAFLQKCLKMVENTDFVEIILTGTQKAPLIAIRGIDNNKVVAMAPLYKKSFGLRNKKDLFGKKFW